MRGLKFRKLAMLGLFASSLVSPTIAFADDPPDPPGGYYYFNDGAGTCGYAQETPWGWQVIMTFPCPRRTA